MVSELSFELKIGGNERRGKNFSSKFWVHPFTAYAKFSQKLTFNLIN